jgi:hypothetical protein
MKVAMGIIVLSGFARSGKDTAGDVLVEEFGFRKVAFADKLREMLYQLDPVIGSGVEETDSGGYRSFNYTIQDVFRREGVTWDNYKESKHKHEIRRLLQRLGTEAGRQTLWDTIWIDAALAGRQPDENIVITDGRFFSEFDAVRERGGKVWRIERVGVGPQSDHASEIEAITYPYFDRRLVNAGTLEDFKQTIREEYSLFRDAEPEAHHGLVKGWSKDSQPKKEPRFNPNDGNTDEQGLRGKPVPDKWAPKGGSSVDSATMPKKAPGRIGGSL